MADFAARYLVYNTQAFQVRVGIAVTRVALEVANETVAKPVWARKRWELSRYVLADPIGVTQRFALLLASQDVPVDEPDEALQNKVRDVWDAAAGVTPEDRGQ
jgi:hypothetical protein